MSNLSKMENPAKVLYGYQTIPCRAKDSFAATLEHKGSALHFFDIGTNHANVHGDITALHQCPAIKKIGLRCGLV